MVVLTTAMVARIRQLRVEGLSQRSVAAIVGVHQRTVEKYETEEKEQKERARERKRGLNMTPEQKAKKSAAALEWYYRNRK